MRIQYIVPDIDECLLIDKVLKVRRLYGTNTPFFLTDLKLVDAPDTLTPTNRYDETEWIDSNGERVWDYIEEIGFTKNEVSTHLVKLIDECWVITKGDSLLNVGDIIVGITLQLDKVTLRTADRSIYEYDIDEYKKLSMTKHNTEEIFPTYVPTTTQRFDGLYVVPDDAKFVNSNLTPDRLKESTNGQPFRVMNCGYSDSMWYEISPKGLRIHISDMCQLERVDETTTNTPTVTCEQPEVKIERKYTSLEQINADIERISEFLNYLHDLSAGIEYLPSDSNSSFTFECSTVFTLPKH